MNSTQPASPAIPLPLLSQEPTQHVDCCLSLSAPLFECVASLILDAVADSAVEGLSPASSSSTAITSGKDRSEILVLSIGCGSGIFEALLQSYLDSQLAPRFRWARENFDSTVVVEGVEVYSAATEGSIKYLREQARHFVAGTWDLCNREITRRAQVLVFVYPREAELVKRYMERCLPRRRRAPENTATAAAAAADSEAARAAGPDEENVRLVLWFGPRSDWAADYERVFRQVAEDYTTAAAAASSEWIVEAPREIENAGLAAYEMAVAVHVRPKKNMKRILEKGSMCLAETSIMNRG